MPLKHIFDNLFTAANSMTVCVLFKLIFYKGKCFQKTNKCIGMQRMWNAVNCEKIAFRLKEQNH